MPSVAELMSQNITNATVNSQTWGGILYNVKAYGAKGVGTDETAAIQATIDAAVTAGAKSVFFPKGNYVATSLTNTGLVIFIGDNATLTVGGTAVDVWQLGKELTNRHAFNYTPAYDLAANVLASTLYHDLGTFTIPTGKNWYVNHVQGTNNSVGSGYLRAFSFDLTAGANATADSVRGCIGVVKSSGAATVKALHGTAQGLVGHTGSVVGVVGESMPASTSGESWAFQATCGNYTQAAMVFNPVNSGDTISYGIRNRGDLNISTAWLLYDSDGNGDILKARDSTGNTVKFSIDKYGNIIGGVDQTYLRLKNATRTYDIQAVSTGDYIRIMGNFYGDIAKFYGDGSFVVGESTTGGPKGAGTINAQGFYTNGTKVVGAQQAAIATPAADVNSLKTAVDAIRAALTAHGLTA